MSYSGDNTLSQYQDNRLSVLGAQSTVSIESLESESDPFDDHHQPDIKAKRGSFAKIKSKVKPYQVNSA